MKNDPFFEENPLYNQPELQRVVDKMVGSGPISISVGRDSCWEALDRICSDYYLIGWDADKRREAIDDAVNKIKRLGQSNYDGLEKFMSELSRVLSKTEPFAVRSVADKCRNVRELYNIVKDTYDKHPKTIQKRKAVQEKFERKKEIFKSLGRCYHCGRKLSVFTKKCKRGDWCVLNKTRKYREIMREYQLHD